MTRRKRYCVEFKREALRRAKSLSYLIPKVCPTIVDGAQLAINRQTISGATAVPTLSETGHFDVRNRTL
jgi:hypothetical protein